MNLTNTQRALKVAGNLLANPDLIPCYLLHNFLIKKYPMDWLLPWWSYRAISYVDGIVEGKRIFEYGTGGSTIRFSRKAKSILAVEDNANWANLVKNRIIGMGVGNVVVKEAPFNFINSVDFDKSDYLHAVDDWSPDIVIIDGQENSVFSVRIQCFMHVEPIVAKLGGVIIVDDFWRYHSLLDSNVAKRVEVFESVGPCRFGVTSTAVFHY